MHCNGTRTTKLYDFSRNSRYSCYKILGCGVTFIKTAEAVARARDWGFRVRYIGRAAVNITIFWREI